MLTPEQRRAREVANSLLGAVRDLIARHDATHADLGNLIRLAEIRNEQEEERARNTESARHESRKAPIATTPAPQPESGSPKGGKGNKQSGPNPWLAFAIQALLCLFTALAFGAAAYYAHIAGVQAGLMRRQLEATDRTTFYLRDVHDNECPKVCRHARGASPGFLVAMI